MENPREKGLQVLAAALAAGVAGDGLLRVGPPGVNVLLWAALLVILVLLLARGRPVVSRVDDTAAALMLLLFAAGFAWRDASNLMLLNAFAISVVIVLAALRVPMARLAASGLLDGARGALFAAFHVAFGLFLLVFKDTEWKAIEGRRWTRRTASVASGMLMGVPLLLLFGSLLMGADAVFSSLVRKAFHLDLSQLLSHIFLALFFAWIVGGFLWGVFFFRPESFPLPARPRGLVAGITEVAVALGLVDALFLAFVWVEFRYFFGGAALVGVTPGLTYAEYARHGFFELVAVSALALALLLGTHWLLRKESPHDERIFRLVAGVQVALLFVIMASALERMKLYQQAYGLTELRLYTTAFMLWLAVVFAWFLMTVLRGRREQFALGATVAGFAAVIVLGAINPDAVIARVNIQRAAEGKNFDVVYVRMLSADAVPTIVAGLPKLAPQDRCAIAPALLNHWSSSEPVNYWRTWNYSRSRAHEAVLQEAAIFQGWRCPQPKP